jgi:HPt (histidine-containing phosphotransfer) domain-containing protein
MADVIYVNFDEGVKRVMNNAKFYVKMLGKFKTDTNLNDLNAALEAGETEKAREAAHTIKGLAANLALTELFNQSLALETQLKAGAASPEQITTVKNVFDKTLEEVQKVIEANA